MEMFFCLNVVDETKNVESAVSTRSRTEEMRVGELSSVRKPRGLCEYGRNHVAVVSVYNWLTNYWLTNYRVFFSYRKK